MHLLNLWRLICEKRIRTDRGSKYQMHCIKINLKNLYPHKVVVHVYTTIQTTVFMWISAKCRSLQRCREQTTFSRVLRFYHLLHSRLLEEYIDVPAPLWSERGLFHPQETGCDVLCVMLETETYMPAASACVLIDRTAHEKALLAHVPNR
jgi:hypothetical protein